MVLLLVNGPPFINRGVSLGTHLAWYQGDALNSGRHPSRLAVHPLSRGRARCFGGRRRRLSRRCRFPKRGSIFNPIFLVRGTEGLIHFLFRRKCVIFVQFLLDMLVARRVPTPCHRDAYLVGTPRWACWEKYGQTHCKTTFSPLTWCFLLVSKKDHF